VRALGRSPLEQALTEVNRLGSKEALAGWADTHFADEDPILRRVAEEVDRFLASRESGSLRAWIEARDPFDDLDDDRADGAVSLLTFHGAKGREWAFVVLAGLEDGDHCGSASRGGAAVLRGHHACDRSVGDHQL
jgi:superfamily I DNA/RNA helicase